MKCLKHGQFYTTHTPLLAHKSPYISLKKFNKISNFTEHYHNASHASYQHVSPTGVIHKSHAKPIKHKHMLKKMQRKVKPRFSMVILTVLACSETACKKQIECHSYESECHYVNHLESFFQNSIQRNNQGFLQKVFPHDNYMIITRLITWLITLS